MIQYIRTHSTKFIVLGFLSLAMSCQKDNVISSSDSASTKDQSISDAYFEDSDGMSLNVAQSALGRLKTDERLCEKSKVTVTKTTATSGQVYIQLDTTAANTGCTDDYGYTRKGNIHLTYSYEGPVGNGTTTVTMTFENYFINNVNLKGTRTLKIYQNGNPTEISILSGLVVFPDSAMISCNGNFTRAVNTGTGTITITGSSSGVVTDAKTRLGAPYTMEITTDLVYDESCYVAGKLFMPVSGVKDFTYTSTNKSLTINYGNGTCDQSVVVNSGGDSYTVTLTK